MFTFGICSFGLARYHTQYNDTIALGKPPRGTPSHVLTTSFGPSPLPIAGFDVLSVAPSVMVTMRHEGCVTSSMHMFTFLASPLPPSPSEVPIFAARMLTDICDQREGGSVAELCPSSGLLARRRSQPGQRLVLALPTFAHRFCSSGPSRKRLIPAVRETLHLLIFRSGISAAFPNPKTNRRSIRGCMALSTLLGPS